MFSEDYVIRMLSQAIAALATVLGLKKAGKYEEALQAIDQALEQLLGLKPEIIKQLEDKSLLQLLTKEQQLDTGRLAVVADLFKEEGDILAALQQPGASKLSYLRALAYTLETGFDPDLQGSAELGGKIEALIERLERSAIPDSTLWTLFCYYEQTGAYAKAAETLAEMASHAAVSTEIRPEQLAFYERLCLKPEADLAAGGLSLSEARRRLEEAKAGS